MSLNIPRRSPQPWSWKLIGLLQLGNAVAFGAVAATVDFSGDASGDHVAVATSGTSGPPESDTATPAAVVATDDPSSATPPSEAAVDDNPDATMPTFSIEPTSPAAEPVSSATPSGAQAQPFDPLAGPAIVNPASNALAVRFVVNGELVELQPGERRVLSGGDSWVVRFHRGGEFGAALEPIYDGTHQFVIGSQGWRLERTDDAP